MAVAMPLPALSVPQRPPFAKPPPQLPTCAIGAPFGVTAAAPATRRPKPPAGCDEECLTAALTRGYMSLDSALYPETGTMIGYNTEASKLGFFNGSGGNSNGMVVLDMNDISEYQRMIEGEGLTRTYSDTDSMQGGYSNTAEIQVGSQWLPESGLHKKPCNLQKGSKVVIILLLANTELRSNRKEGSRPKIQSLSEERNRSGEAGGPAVLDGVAGDVMEVDDGAEAEGASLDEVRHLQHQLDGPRPVQQLPYLPHHPLRQPRRPLHAVAGERGGIGWIRIWTRGDPEDARLAVAELLHSHVKQRRHARVLERTDAHQHPLVTVTLFAHQGQQEVPFGDLLSSVAAGIG
ncbi:hypothetical protein ZWY2020_015863 [Hordeum vulgare]|nr:hypothetical protein ZWY2020_015863 [Hordeum vulgare]